MAGWHYWLDGRESEWTPGVGDGQGGLACCDSWGRKELDTTERLNWTELNGRTSQNLTYRRQWHPTPVLLPWKSHGCRSLVGCNPWVTKSQTWLSDFTSLSIFMHWRRKWQPTPVFLPGESHGWSSLSHRVRHDLNDLAAAVFGHKTKICLINVLVKVKLLCCVRLCDSMYCSLPSSSVHGIFQARLLSVLPGRKG